MRRSIEGADPAEPVRLAEIRLGARLAAERQSAGATDRVLVDPAELAGTRATKPEVGGQVASPTEARFAAQAEARQQGIEDGLAGSHGSHGSHGSNDVDGGSRFASDADAPGSVGKESRRRSFLDGKSGCYSCGAGKTAAAKEACLTSRRWLRASRWEIAGVALAFATALAAPLAAASQQESHTFTLGLLGGVGGSFDADPDPGLGETSYMLQVGMVTEPRTLVSIRVGRLTLEGDEGFEKFSAADLEYVNIAGEYRFAQSYYDYGVYLGVGYYELGGDLRSGGRDSEADLGIVLGFTGDFDVTRYISVVGELSAHYAFLDQAAIFGMANIGLAVHF